MAATKSPLTEDVLNSPAMAAPPGLAYNFVNPPNLDTEYYIDLLICLTISSMHAYLDESSLDSKIRARRL